MLTISKMTDDDLAQAVAIERLSFNVPKEEAVFHHDENKYLVAREKEKVIGYIGVEDISGEKHIINMAVHPGHRKQGVGKRLIEAVLNDKDVFFLEVRVSNEPALNLYKKYGFKSVGLRKNYYQDNGEDAYVMRREPDLMTND